MSGSDIATGVVIIVILALVQLAVHLESRALGDTRKQRRNQALARERTRLFWSIRELEREVLGIEWCGPDARR